MIKSINELSFTLSEVKGTWSYDDLYECYSIDADIQGYESDVVYYPEDKKLCIYYLDDTVLTATLERFSSNPDTNESIIDELIMEQCSIEEQLELNEIIS